MTNHAYVPRYDWFDYPAEDPGDGLFAWLPEHVGARVRLLANPTWAEVRAETKLFMDSLGADIDAQDAYAQHVAPRIVDWNLYVRDEGGDERKLPPPAERWESLFAIEFNLFIWMRTMIHLAHRPKMLTSSRAPAGATDSTPSITPAPPSSPAPSPSASTASA